LQLAKLDRTPLPTRSDTPYLISNRNISQAIRSHGENQVQHSFENVSCTWQAATQHANAFAIRMTKMKSKQSLRRETERHQPSYADFHHSYYSKMAIDQDPSGQKIIPLNSSYHF